jgi:hypothetical protein
VSNDEKKIAYVTNSEDIENMSSGEVSAYIKSNSESGNFAEADKAYYTWSAKQAASVTSDNYVTGEENADTQAVFDAHQESRKRQETYNNEKSQNYDKDYKASKTPKGKKNQKVETFTNKKAVETSGENSGIVNELPPGSAAQYKGVLGNALVGDEVPSYNKTKSEKVLEGKHNSSIVFGRDRPASVASGYSGTGDTQAGSIDIVAGRMGYKARSKNVLGDRLFVDPNFKGDAARIYISQKSDIDDYMDLADGIVGNSKTRSSIGIKADGVRIVAREGIKLVTRTDRVNSQGGDVVDVNGIDLIATNDDTDLQPMVKGRNLVESLKELTKQVNDLNGIVDSLLQYQTYLNERITNHYHYGPAYVHSYAGWGFIWETTPSPPLMAAGQKTMIDHLSQTKRSLMIQKGNLAQFQTNYLNPSGKKYINSRFNNTN